MTAHDLADVRTRLTDFFTERVLAAGLAAQLDPRTPLKEWGVLDSLGMARLVAFVRDELGVAIPLRQLTGRNFRTIEDIAVLVVAAAQEV
jgi:acyl carrier protein